jgi:hypothetical protein
VRPFNQREEPPKKPLVPLFPCSLVPFVPLQVLWVDFGVTCYDRSCGKRNPQLGYLFRREPSASRIKSNDRYCSIREYIHRFQKRTATFRVEGYEQRAPFQ